MTTRIDGTLVWVCVAREGGVLDDIEVVGSEAEADTVVAGWVGDMDPSVDPEHDGSVWYDLNGNDWYFDIWPKVIGTVPKG